MTINGFKLTAIQTNGKITANLFLINNTEISAKKEFDKSTPLKFLIIWADNQMKELQKQNEKSTQKDRAKLSA